MNRKDWGPADALMSAEAFPDRVQQTSALWGLAFDAAAAEYVLLGFHAPSGMTGTLYLDIDWATTATSGNVVWVAYVQAVTPADAQNVLTTWGPGAVNTTTTAAAASAGYLTRTTITLTNTDGMAAGDQVWLLVGRDGASGSDTCAADAVVFGFTFRDSA